MKEKYFTAANQNAAEAMAEAYFGCDKSALQVDVISGEENSPCMILAMTGIPAELQNSEAYFELYYEKDGVYLEVYPPRGAGAGLNVAELTKYISRKSISGINLQAVQAIMALKSGQAKIAPAQQEVLIGEDITVAVSHDEAKADAILLEPEPGGGLLDYETALKKVNEAGVTHGIIEKKLRRVLEVKDYGEPYMIAESIPPEDGENGRLVFNFSTDERTGRPREIGGGRVDLRSLDLFEPVVEGQLLVTKIPATEGIAGQSVTGKETKAKPGKDVNLPRGKNVEINAEKTEMRSKCAGMVEFMNNSVNVSSVYKINGDCDISVGNIDFDGTIQISGSVRSGHTIKASGAIMVAGTVEAATLIAGGNVEVKGGMQGADKGRIEAGGSVNIMFVERGTVIAEGSITLDVSIHSVLEAGGSITAKGRRGSIIGGRAGAAGNVVTNCIGAVSRAHTEIEVGMTPRKRTRIQHLEKDLERLKNEAVKLDQLDAYLANSQGKLDPETWNKLHRSGVENRSVNVQHTEECNHEINDLRYELEHATDSKVHVFDTVFDGTRIIIGNGMYKVNEEIKFATFKYKDTEVVYRSCELSKPKN